MKPTLKHSRTRYRSKLREVGLWRSEWQQQGEGNQIDEGTRSLWTKELRCEVTEAAGKSRSFLEVALGLLQGDVEVELELEMVRPEVGT